MQMIFGGWIGASSLASSMGTRSGGIESGMIEPHGSLARGGVPSREEMTSPFSVVSTSPWCTRFDNWKRQYFIVELNQFTAEPAEYAEKSRERNAGPSTGCRMRSSSLGMTFESRTLTLQA